MKNNILAIICVIGATAILADVPKPIDIQDEVIDALLRQSELQMQTATEVAKKVDKISEKQMQEMTESIAKLQKENKLLSKEIYEIKNTPEPVIDNSIPFRLEPILSDTTN